MKTSISQFDKSGKPTSNGWESANLPGVTDEAAYALEITGNSMQPVYREGDTIIVSPAAKVHNGDRVVVRTNDGQVMAMVLKRQTARKIELASFNLETPVMALDAKSVEWMARIIWASQ
jgi:phage repressor protein C with HTH and peptisase S24 domain